MKQRAYLYIRVSTEEQAEKGYSQKHQDERLREHCKHHNMSLLMIALSEQLTEHYIFYSKTYSL